MYSFIFRIGKIHVHVYLTWFFPTRQFRRNVAPCSILSTSGTFNVIWEQPPITMIGHHCASERGPICVLVINKTAGASRGGHSKDVL